MRFPGFDDEWTKCKVSDFGKVVTGSTPSTSDIENYADGIYLWASPADLGQSKYIAITKTKLSDQGFACTRSLPRGSILVSCIGIIGKIGVAVQEMSSNQQINTVIPSKQFVGEYIYYALASKVPKYSRLAATQVVPILNKRDFEQLSNAYPSSTEQEKIASFLSLLDERIACLSETIKDRKTEKQAFLRRLFDQSLRFPGFSDEWAETTLGKIGYSYNGLSGKSADDFGRGKPYITYKMVYESVKINLNKVEYVLVADNEEQNQVKQGDILFTVSSETPNETGLCSVLTSNISELYLNSFCFGYRLNHEVLAQSIFLAYALRSPFYRLSLSALAQGCTRYNISKREVMRMPLTLPPLSEQKKIASFLSLIDERIETEEDLLRQYEIQKKYFLQRMFV